MERSTAIKKVKELFGKNFIGMEELSSVFNSFPLKTPGTIPEIPFTEQQLTGAKDAYFLILGISQMDNGEPVTLRTLRNLFGINPDLFEPCFYNQDWYLKEDFLDKPLECKWYLLRKNVYENSRAVQPSQLERQYTFPPAILCAYTFFIYWFLYNEALWKYDFLWCNDTDHNGDRIYVGKYVDIDRINKNGFSIHRHLGLRNCYGAIDI